MMKIQQQARERRGVILIVALGLLALFAALGLSFAVIARYEAQSARNFKLFFQDNSATAKIDMDVLPLAEFGISQLIYDTQQRNSALRGHSLLRDMYGSPTTTQYDSANEVFLEVPGADPEARNTNANETYRGSYNGTGIFAPLDDPTNSSDFTDATVNLSTDPVKEGVIENVEVAYFMSRLRPVIEMTHSGVTTPGAGEPIVTFGTANTIPTLFPTFPFNFMHFDLLVDNANNPLRIATFIPGSTDFARHYDDNRHPERYSTDSAGTTDVTFFGYDEDYDYPDYNNMFLAMERADGQILIPSFHRPHLIKQLEDAGVFVDDYGTPAVGIGQAEPNVPPLNQSRRTLAWRDRKNGRATILRPRELEYNASLIFNNSTRGNRWRDLLDLDGSGVAGDTPEELDVDTDGDGKKDAIWMDLGHPVRTIAGRQVKPLFAFKVLSLDGKINLNAHGNYFPEDGRPIVPSITDTGFGELHNSNLGATTFEVNPKHAFLLHHQLRNSDSGELELPEWQEHPTNISGGHATLGTFGPVEYKAMLGLLEDRTTTYPNLLSAQTQPGRFTRFGFQPSAVDGPGVSRDPLDQATFTDDPMDDNRSTYPSNEYSTYYNNAGTFAGRIDYHGLGRYFEPFNLNWYELRGVPAPADVVSFQNLSGFHLNYPGVAGGTYAGNNRDNANRNYSPVTLNELLATKDDAIETNLFQRTQSDSLFTAGDIEKLYRIDDIDSTVLSSRLTLLLENSFGEPTPTSANQQILARESYARQRMRRMFTHESWDLNRFNFPPYFTAISDATAGFDEDGSTRLPAVTYTKPASLPDDPVPTPPDGSASHRGDVPFAAGAQNLLQWISEGLHTRLNLSGPSITADADPLRPFISAEPLTPPGTPDPNQASVIDADRTNFAAKIYALLCLAVRPDPGKPGQTRTLAQLAVNIVDFMDPDDAMTALRYDDDLSTFINSVDPTDFAGAPDKVVFGFELPKLVVNEALILQYQHHDGTGAPVTPSNDTVWAFVELKNSSKSEVVDLVNPSITAPTPRDYSSYQIRIIEGSGGGNPASFVQPIDFKHPTSIVGQAPSYPTGPSVGQIQPGEIFLIGPPAPSADDAQGSGGPNDLDGIQKSPADQVLFLDYDPMKGGTLNNFTSDDMRYERPSQAGVALPFEIGLYRLRNPYRPFDTDTNPYVQVDHVRVELSTTYPSATGGAWEINIDNTLPALADRVTRRRTRTWHGETRTWTAAGADFAFPAIDFEVANYLGAPDIRVNGLSSGFTPGSNSDAHTLIVDPQQPGRALAENNESQVNGIVEYSFPFLNRPPASPLELLSVRLYGSHRWQDYATLPNSLKTPLPGFAVTNSNREWKMRFTDDFGYDEVLLSRARRDRTTRWFEDNRHISAAGGAFANFPLPDLYRFFEFVECRNRSHGAELQDQKSQLYPRQVRLPGKICLNTITEEEVFRALFDDAWVMPVQAMNRPNDPHPPEVGEPVAPYRLPINYWDSTWNGTAPYNPGYNPRFPYDPRRNLQFGRLFNSSYGSDQIYATPLDPGFPLGRRLTNSEVSGTSIFFGDPVTLTSPPTSGANYWHRTIARQWPGIDADSSTSPVLPGRDPTAQVHSEVYRMFLLSRAGADGITGTGDDKPFRSFASPRLSDTILRQRNYSQLDAPEGTKAGDATQPEGAGELIPELVGALGGGGPFNTSPSWTPRLFDPVPTPLLQGAAPLSATDIAESIGEDQPQNATNGFHETGPLNVTTNAAVMSVTSKDEWMLEQERNRLLGKIAGNVTTRSHVYACWMTVGFFAVEPGTEFADVPCLNEEIGIDDGTNIRHRLFFIVDRSKATKYNGPPPAPVSLEEMESEGLLTLPGRVSVIE